MAWSPPHTYANLEVPNAALLNTDIRDNMRELWHEIAYAEWIGQILTTNIVVDTGAQTYTAVPIFIEFFAPAANSGASDAITVRLYDGATQLGVLARVGLSDVSVFAARRLTPTAGSHQYLVKVHGGSAGNGQGGVSGGTIGTSASTAYVPGFIRIMQKGA